MRRALVPGRRPGLTVFSAAAPRLRVVVASVALSTAGALYTVARAQAPASAAAQDAAKSADHPVAGAAAGAGTKDPAQAQKGTAPTDSKQGSSKPSTTGVGDSAASDTKLRLGPLDPAPKPANVPHNRPVIGLAMGGGAALGLSEIGTLAWFEEHHIPVDVIAGTSMGSILAALYSTGHTPEQMKHVLTPDSVNRVFRIGSDYSALNYRRREDEREIPAGIGIGLKHGATLRNSLLTDTGLNELLDREFMNYSDQTEFNNLPIPFRCQATDLTDAKSVTFSRGSLPDAVRASASIPGVFRPFTMNGHEFVDGAILENLPTTQVKAMGADVIIAISLPLQPIGKEELTSIPGVLSRAFAVGIEVNEQHDRQLADVLLMPDTRGFGASDYLKIEDLTRRGYDAAEAHKAELLKYALPDDQWNEYLAHRAGKQRPPAGNIIQVKVKAPNPEVAEVVHTLFNPLIGKPADPEKIEKLTAQLRADGRYDVDYTVGYDAPDSNTPIILVAVNDKKTGPPFLHLGLDMQAQTGGVTRATVAATLNYQDLGGYGDGLRVNMDAGFLTRVQGEYFWKPRPLGSFFLAPRAEVTRQPFYIYQVSTQGDAAPVGDYRLSERQWQSSGFAGDAGWTDGKYQELRAGWDFENVQWTATTGADQLPDYESNSQTARVKYTYDNQDRALVPRYGVRAITSFGYLYGTADSPSAPRFEAKIGFAQTLSAKNTFLMNMEGATLFHRDVAQPFRFTLGGPLRLAASAIDEYRGTDYFLLTPGYLRRLAQLPAPFGSNIYVGGTYEIGQMRAPEYGTLTRQDVYFGVVAETPFGVITLAPAFGDHNNRKFVFTLGRLF